MLSYSFGDATFCIHCYHVHLTCYPLEVLCINNNGLCFFFKRKTAYEFRIGDWSSDVCSSDLLVDMGLTPGDIEKMDHMKGMEHMEGMEHGDEETGDDYN